MLLKNDEIDAMVPRLHRHQFNDNAVRMTRPLSDTVGMKRLGIHLVHLQPGHESTEFHYHDADEEFLYVLSGRGIAEIGDERFEVGPGTSWASERLRSRTRCATRSTRTSST